MRGRYGSKLVFILTFIVYLFSFYKSVNEKIEQHLFSPHQKCVCNKSHQDKAVTQAVNLNRTFCSEEAHQRGSHQKIIAFTYYGDPKSQLHKKRSYFQGIKENAALISKLYGSDWIMRLYHDMSEDIEIMSKLCDISCELDNLDLCDVKNLPSGDFSDMLAALWRTLPTLDPQVDILLNRDLDSRVSEREVAAVQEWLNSDKEFHVMRDHPQHIDPILAGLWGTKLTSQMVRKNWWTSLSKFFTDATFDVSNDSYGLDQVFLPLHVWTWAESFAMQHDSYRSLNFFFIILLTIFLGVKSIQIQLVFQPED